MSLMRRILYFSREIGFDPLKTFNAIKFIPRYVINFFNFLIQSKSIKINVSPALNDYRASSGSASGHYFWQDLICANWIYSSQPDRHFDVGSRVDGFIAHVAVFMKVFQLDIRKLNSEVPNLTFLEGNAQEPLEEFKMQFESVSSLHSIEHFGLGRYGDKLDIFGHVNGILNISECVALNGLLYVSFPIGEPRVEFNSQRIIHPEWPLDTLKNFKLEKFVLIPWKTPPIYGISPEEVDLKVQGQAGLYCLRRVA